MTDQSQINKKSLSERDICTKFITPAIQCCATLEARLQSADAARERGRLVATVMSTVGG